MLTSRDAANESHQGQNRLRLFNPVAHQAR